MLPSYKRFFYQYRQEHDELREFQWRSIDNANYELIVPRDSDDEIIRVESFSLEYPIKVSDPYLIKFYADKPLSYSTELKKLIATQDSKRTTVFKQYWDPSNLMGSLPAYVKSVTVSTNIDNIFVSELSKPVAKGIFSIPPYGVYKVTYQSHSSPTLRSIKDESVQSEMSVQGESEPNTLHEQLLGNFYSPLPTDNLGSFEQSDPETIAYSIYLLILKGDDNHLISLLNQVVSIYLKITNAKKGRDGYFLEEGVTPGLPQTLIRWQRSQPNDHRYVYQLAVLGLAILEALNYFYNTRQSDLKSLSGQFNLEEKISFLLDQIGFICRSSCNEGRSQASSILTEEGYFLADDSLMTTCLCSMFLTELLQVNYDLRNHTVALKLHQKLASYTIDYRSLGAYETVGLILWNIRFFRYNLNAIGHISNLLDRIRNLVNMDPSLEDIPFLLFSQGLILSSFPEASYTDGTLLRDDPFIPFPLEDENGLYRYNNNYPRIVDQTSTLFSQEDYQALTNQEVFPLWQEEIRLLILLSYKESARLLPKGDRWFQPESLERQGSVINSFLLGTAESVIPNLITLVQNWKGTDISKATGEALSKYSQLYLTKPRFSYDTFWNKKIKQFLELDNGSINEIESFIELISEPSPRLNKPDKLIYKVYEEGKLVEKQFYPDSPKDIRGLAKQGELSTVLSVGSNSTVNEFEEFNLDSDILLTDILELPLSSSVPTTVDETYPVRSSQLLSYVDLVATESFSHTLASSLLPIEVKLYSTLTKEYIFSLERDQPTAISVTDGDYLDFIEISGLLFWEEDLMEWGETFLYWR